MRFLLHGKSAAGLACDPDLLRRDPGEGLAARQVRAVCVFGTQNVFPRLLKHWIQRRPFFHEGWCGLMVMKRLESLLLCTEPDSGASTRPSPYEIEEYDPDTSDQRGDDV